ncbi:hypothetical protein BHM03_00051321 [Ensete ventricosum]|nr:hypothetical protein BHM03_00051321 [Ensete ventricosum]
MSDARRVFEDGEHKVRLLSLEPKAATGSSPSPPPKPLLVAFPSEEGEYPTLVFLHGYLLYNSFYSQLLHHVASHGFIIVAPQVRWNDFSSGRPLVPAGRSGRVGSRRNPSDGQVSLVVDFAIPLLRRDAGAFIATVTGYPYLNHLSSLLLTIPLLLTTPFVVLATRHAPAAEGCRLCPPYLC